MNDLVNISQLARIMKVSIRWLRQETDAGRIPHLSAGNDTLYNLSVVQDVFAKRAGQTSKTAELRLSGGQK